MKNWLLRNYRTIIILAFLIPIITVAVVSISHVTVWYGISNPMSWAVYLSIGIEIAALSALAAISADMGSKVYFPFGIVTLIQFIGNIYFSHQYIEVESESFKDWVELVAPLIEYIGIESTDFVGHKRFLALFTGGMLPIISLSFLHMLIKFTDESKKTQPEADKKDIEEKIDAKDLNSELTRLRLSDQDLKILENAILNPPEPNEELKKAADDYRKELAKDIRESLKPNNKVESTKLFDDDEFKDLYGYEDYLKQKKENEVSHDDYIDYVNYKNQNEESVINNETIPNTTEELLNSQLNTEAPNPSVEVTQEQNIDNQIPTEEKKKN